MHANDWDASLAENPRWGTNFHDIRFEHELLDRISSNSSSYVAVVAIASTSRVDSI